jgi:hypothetical protein
MQNVSTATVGQSQLGNYNDKRAFASWVRCRREKDACIAMALKNNHTRHNNRNELMQSVDDSVVGNTQIYTRGIPSNHIL